MAGFDPEQMIRREGKDTWIKVTPGRLETFLTYYIDDGAMEGRNVGTAERFLALLEYVAQRDLTNRKLLTTCDVYVIGGPDGVKIGIAADPEDRVARLQTGAGSKLSLLNSWRFPRRRVAFDIERRAHHALKHKCMLNEWFAVAPEEAIACVEAVITAYERESANGEESA